MKKTIVLAALLLSISLTTGCATILKGKTQKVNIATSNNKQITVTVDGKTAQVPGVVEVKRREAELVISTKEPGCTPQTVAANEVESAFWVNILSGGAFGSTTDYATESMWKYDENITVNCK